MLGLEITTVIGCRNNCVYCPQSVLLQNYKSSEKILTLQNFVKYLSSVPQYISIHFSGFAEPYLNPECTNMIDHVYKRNHSVIIYSTLRGCQIKDLAYLLDKNISLNLHIPRFESMQINHDIIKNFCEKVEFLKKENFNFVAWNIGNYEIDPQIFNVLEGEYKTEPIISRAGNLTKQVNHTGALTCKGLRYEQNVLLPNGDIVLCCQDYGLKHILGNLGKKKYKDIFRDEKYIEILNGMKSGEKNILCRHCERGIKL